jgi:hypothetical protein
LGLDLGLLVEVCCVCVSIASVSVRQRRREGLAGAMASTQFLIKWNKKNLKKNKKYKVKIKI